MALTKISTAMISQDAASVDLNIDAGTLYIDSTNNRVGIGNTSPETNLHIEDGSSYSLIRLVASTASVAGIDFGDADDRDIGRVRYNNSDNSMVFHTNAAEQMRIDSSGNVLVGTTDTTPYNNNANSAADRAIVLRSEGYISAAAYNQSALDINRTGNNGNIANFYQSGTIVGRIGSDSTDNFYITAAAANHSGLYFSDVGIAAMQAGSLIDNAVNLGSATYRFKRLYLSDTLYGPATFTIDPATHDDNTGTVVIAGNLQVDGTTTTINSTTVNVDDVNIQLATGATNAAAAAGAGITVDRGADSDTYFKLDTAGSHWISNQPIHIQSNTGLGIGADASSFGSGVSTILLQGTASNGRAGALWFKEQDGSNTTALYSTDGADGYGTVLAAYQGKMQFGIGGLASSNIALAIDTNKNVGIGTTSPSAPLEIAGAANATDTGITIKNGSATRVRLFHNDNAGASFLTSYDVGATQILHIRGGNSLTLSGGGGTEHMRINTSGNVGIGTDSPESLLTLENDDAILRIRSATTTTKGLSLRYNDSGNFGQLLVDHQGNNQLAMKYYALSHTFGRSDSAQYATIDSSGNVGIGTTSPQAALHIFDTPAEILRMQGNDEYAYASFYGTVSASESRLGYMGFANDTSTAADFNFTNSQGGIFSFNAGIETVGTVHNNSTQVGFKHTAHGVATGNTNKHSFQIGRWIGSYNKWMMVPETEGTPTYQKEFGFDFEQNGWFVEGTFTTDVVGVGTSSPRGELEIESSGVTNLYLTRNDASINNTNSLGVISFSGTEDDSTYIDGAQVYAKAEVSWSSGDYKTGLAFATNSGNSLTERMRLDRNGNLGIGTYSPNFSLDISGADNSQLRLLGTDTNPTTIVMDYNSGGATGRIRIQNDDGDMKFTTNNGNVRQTILENGNIGIGTSSPSEKLTVAGPIGVSATGYTANATTANFGLYTSGLVDTTYIQMPASGQFQVWKPSTGAVVTVLENGNVGINQTNPTHRLQVSVDTDGAFIKRDVASNAANLSEFNSHRSLLLLNRNAGSYLAFGGNSSRTDIQATDLAGTPTAKNISLNPFGGNVGIGTATPEEKLDVVGEIHQSHSNAESKTFPVHFVSGNTTSVTTISNTDQSTAVVATFEFIGVYAYAGSNMSTGKIMAATRRSSSNTAWTNRNNVQITVTGDLPTNNYPNSFFWDNGVLKVTTDGSHVYTGTITITYYNCDIS